DLSSWYKESLAPKIELIRDAIEHCRELQFTYYAPLGDSERCIQPYYLIFRWSSWYVWGWCKVREDFRLFKLNRLDNVQLSETVFVKQSVPLPDLTNEHIFPGGIHVKALFDAGCKWRLVEEFGPHCFEEQKDETLLFHADYTDKENLIAWILTFREQVQLLEPEEIRIELQQIIEKMRERYS
ncbi:MAG: WYL domain-containing protein, partial [Clostridia bacterium]|nr:WYL domain-containing protein [Clostridia bacterium]